MGSNNGTGQPYRFMCPKCRLSATRRRHDQVRIERTGRIKPLTSSQRGNGGRRVLQERHEFRCLTCHHVGWSRHRQILDHPVVPDPDDVRLDPDDSEY